jgi:hypothetical protein
MLAPRNVEESVLIFNQFNHCFRCNFEGDSPFFPLTPEEVMFETSRLPEIQDAHVALWLAGRLLTPEDAEAERGRRLAVMTFIVNTSC